MHVSNCACSYFFNGSSSNNLSCSNFHCDSWARCLFSSMLQGHNCNVVQLRRHLERTCSLGLASPVDITCETGKSLVDSLTSSSNWVKFSLLHRQIVFQSNQFFITWLIQSHFAKRLRNSGSLYSVVQNLSLSFNDVSSIF